MLYTLLGLVVFLIALGFVWRFASERRSIPLPVWLRGMVEMDNPFTAANRSAVILQRLDLQPGMKVLDIGCGPGRLTIPAARQVGPEGEVVAVDLQQGMLDRAREKAREANLNNIRFVQVGMGEGKLEVGVADRALLVTVLGEIPNREGAMKEIFDALKPGGILSVTETVFDPHYQRRETISQLAATVGFQQKAFFGNRVGYILTLQKPA